MRQRYGYRDGRYRGSAGTDRMGILGFFLSMALGVGIPSLLTVFLQNHLPLPQAMAAMAATVIVGMALSWLCKKQDWPLLSLFQLFSIITMLFLTLTLQIGVIQRVVFCDRGYLGAVSVGAGLLTTAGLLRWMKKREDRPSLFLRGFFALFLGVLVYCFSLDGLMGVDVLADRGQTQQTVAQVTRVEQERRRTHGRVQHDYTVYFAVVKENDLTSGGRFPIDKAAYDSLRPGDEVELILHPGALGVEWLECVPLHE